MHEHLIGNIKMKYINRKEVFKDQIFASFISGWQKTRYPSEIAERKEGEHYDEKTDSFRSRTGNPRNHTK